MGFIIVSGLIGGLLLYPLFLYCFLRTSHIVTLELRIITICTIELHVLLYILCTTIRFACTERDGEATFRV